MKNKPFLYTALLSTLLLVLLITCKKESIKVAPTVTLSTVSNITSNSATSGGNVTSDGGSTVTAKGVCWGTNQNPTTSDSKTNNGPASGSFTSSITGLNPGTTYTIRAYAINAIGTAYSSQSTFTTEALAPVLTTTDLTAITSTTATSGGNITADGGSAVTARGVCWAITQNPTTAGSKTTDGAGSGIFTSNLTGLLPGTTYYIKAYATNSIGTTYGNQVTLTTTSVAPTLTTTAPSAITSTTATSGGNITSEGGSAVTARGVCWATTQNPTTTNSKTTDGTGPGTFTSNLTGLIPGTTYYVKAYATNSIGTTYGSQVTFVTLTSAPILTTNAATAITSTTATSGGNITSDGGSAVTVRGVCWATTANPTVANSKITNGTNIGTFTSNITGLASGTTYYLRAFATNGIGTSYGDQITFLSQGLVPATFTDFDGNVYHAVVIGTQTWMVENLKTTHYRNGAAITNVTIRTTWNKLTTEAYCWYNNDPSNKVLYGAMYNWFAVNDSRNIAPAGWHVPTEAEWVTLGDYLGGTFLASGKLKESGVTHWKTPNEGATNSSGFTGLPGGARGFNTGDFQQWHEFGYFWSNTMSNNGEAYERHLYYNTNIFQSSSSNPRSGNSVRCIRD
jgi:uncharacterized protein (TIGR02145 family)